MPPRPSTPWPGFRSVLAVLVGAGALMAFLWWQDLSAGTSAAAAPPAPPLPPWTGPGDRSGQVATEVRAMNLVTSEVRTSVAAESSDTSLMGDVTATVTAPVRLLYATDLSKLAADSITFSPIHALYVVRIPPPRMIAAEVLTQFEDAKVETGLFRSRAKDGEYHLGLARRDLNLRARGLTPDKDQLASIRAGAKEQVEALVRKIVGDRAAVVVRFSDERGPD